MTEILVARTWDRVKADLLAEIGEKTYEVWFGRARVLSLRRGVLLVGVPNDFIRSWVAERYAELLGRLERWVRAAVAPDGDESAIMASLRVAEGLAAAHGSVARAGAALTARTGAETALVDLGEALGEVEALLGLRVDDAVLDRIFARFCVGK